MPTLLNQFHPIIEINNNNNINKIGGHKCYHYKIVVILNKLRLTLLVRTSLPSFPSFIRNTMHCSFLTITNSGLTSNTWSNVITSVFTDPESECNSNRLGYSLAYLVCHADANGPPNFLIYP